MKFTNKQGVTLTQHDWIAGVYFDAMNQPTDKNDPQNDENELQINKLFENDPIEDNAANENGNPDHGTLVENEEEIEIEQVIEEMIDELNNDVIPAGEELLNEITDPEPETENDPIGQML